MLVITFIIGYLENLHPEEINIFFHSSASTTLMIYRYI
jgi:hypothetical protein